MPILSQLSNPSLPESIGYGTIIHLVLSLLVFLHVLQKPRDARTALLWIFFATVFPVVGPLAYILFGINTIPHKGWLKQFSDSNFQKRQRLETRTANSLAAMHTHKNLLRVHPAATTLTPLNRVLDHLSVNHPLLGGNQIEFYPSALNALDAMFQTLQAAQHHIHLSTYILNDDAIGKKLMRILAERARAGVQIRILYDAFGSAGANLRLFFWRHRHIPNLQIIGFSQANMLKRKFQLNLRNHRKLLIVDGAIAFIGGINFHAVYLPKGNTPGVMDYHFRIRGPTVLELQYTFLRDWYYMTDEPVEKLLSRDLFPLSEASGQVAMRLQNSGPTRDEASATLDTFFAAYNLAQKQILIVTPYFVPPESLILALRQAAYRGVDVKILVPAHNNHPTLQLASQALYKPLLTAGVRIFEHHPPFIHAKATIIDDTVAIIGSANIDPRSLFLNYETNLIVFNEVFASTLKAHIVNELTLAREITYAEWRQRPRLRKLAENFFNLFHPIA